MREHYKLPNLDEVLSNLNNAFSKVDVQEAFWSPFGRYRWARLPFGVKVSSEIFQMRLNEALEGLTYLLSPLRARWHIRHQQESATAVGLQPIW